MNYKSYIVRKRCKIDAICGPVNLPYGTLVMCENGVICTKEGKPICYVASQNARDYFSHNDDGMGPIRGHLVQSIIDVLTDSTATPEALKNRDASWDKVWKDPICKRFRDMNHQNFWVWSISFYHAEIEELRHINKLVGGKSNV